MRLQPESSKAQTMMPNTKKSLFFMLDLLYTLVDDPLNKTMLAT
jgi:hypothetical protein